MSDYEVSTANLATQHVLKSFTYTEPRWSADSGTEATTSMYITNFTQHRPVTWSRWYVCPTCLKELPEEKVHWVDGKPYCKKDAKDVIHDKLTRGG